MNTNEREFPVAMLADGLFYDVLGDGRARYLSTALEKAERGERVFGVAFDDEGADFLFASIDHF